MAGKTDDRRDTRAGDYLDGFLASAFRPAMPDLVEPRPERSHEIELPDQLAGYRVVELIGRGGVGNVYRVADPELGREMAIKVLRRAHAGDAEFVRRFRNEARLSSQLTHPGIVNVHEMGWLEDGRPYFTMRLVEGETFAKILKRRSDETQDRFECLKILTRVCQCLAYVHAKGMIHGDIKPHNVMVGAFGEVQLMDWGFAHHSAAADTAPLAPTLVGGTPAYMAPEQAGPSSGLSLATDVFCIGAILCEVLTGQPPYVGASKHELFDLASEARLEDAHKRLESCGGEKPLVELAHECLQRRPDSRPPDAAAVARRLNSYFCHIEDRARDMEFQAAAARASLEQSRRSRRLGFTLMAFVAGGAFLVSGQLLWNTSQREARNFQVSLAVDDAMKTTARLRSWAEIAPSSESWSKAHQAAHEALVIAETHNADPRLWNRANALLGWIEREKENIARKETLLQRLDAIAPHVHVEHSARRLDAEYTSVFRDAGVDIAAGVSKKTIATLRGFLPAPIIVSTLDTWSRVRRKHGYPDEEAWKVPHEIVKALDTDPWRQIVRDAFRNKDSARLENLAKQAARASSAASLGFLAGCLHDLGRVDEARRVLQRAHDEYPNDAPTNHDLAALANTRDRSEVQEAIRLLSMAVAVRPKSGHLWTDLGLYQLEAGQAKPALQSLHLAKGLVPDSARMWLLTGVAHLALEERQNAKTAFREALNRGHPSAPKYLANLLVHEGRYEPALTILEKARDRTPEDFELLLQLGIVRSRFYQHEQALGLLSKAVAIDPRSIEARCRLGLALMRAGEFDAAISSLQLGARMAREQPTPLPTADWLESARDLLDAAFRYSTLGDATPSHEDLCRFAVVAWRTGDVANAKRLFDAALAHERAHVHHATLFPLEAAFAAAAGGANGRRSLEILSDELERFEKDSDTGDVEPAVIREWIHAWRNAPNLKRFQQAPEWSEFWARADRLLAKIHDRNE